MSSLSLSKFFDELYQSYLDNEKRDCFEDFKTYLELKKIKHEVKFETKNIAKIPTIVVANHFVRPLILRRSMLTTAESMATSAIISLAASMLVGKKTTVVVKNDLVENIFFFSLKLRKIQLASIYCYDFIGVSNNYPFGEFEKWAQTLKSGFNIVAYPEAIVSQQMKKIRPGFENLLSYLKDKKIKYQILPVSVYWTHGQFVVHVAKAIAPSADLAKTANLAMLKIAANLPVYLQGEYKNKVEDFKAQVRKQQANDPKQERLAHLPISI